MTALSSQARPDGSDRSGPAVELYWIPLGAGTPIVQWNGRASEQQRRPPAHVSSIVILP
jgi:hypothetical protein